MPPPAGLPRDVLDPLDFEELMEVYEHFVALCAEHDTRCPDLVLDCGCDFCTPALSTKDAQPSGKSSENGAAGGSGGGGRGRRGKSHTSRTGGLANTSNSWEVMHVRWGSPTERCVGLLIKVLTHVL
jgi:hypothetical protein